MNNILKIAFRLFVVCLISVSALAAVYQLTKQPIDANIQKELAQTLKVIIPANSYKEQTIDNNAVPEGSTKIKQVLLAQTDNKAIGYAIMASSKGYGGDVNFTIAIDTKGKVLGVVVGENAETAGLGTRIKEPAFLNQFIGKTANITIGKGTNAIDTISGSTISSKAALNAINAALSYYEKALKEAK